MQKCTKLRDWKSVRKIMDSSLTSPLRPTLLQFNIFVDSMAKSDNPALCLKYFRIMQDKYTIEPDIVSFSALLKSFRRQGMITEAEEILTEMKIKYGLMPKNLHIQRCYQFVQNAIKRQSKEVVC